MDSELPQPSQRADRLLHLESEGADARRKLRTQEARTADLIAMVPAVVWEAVGRPGDPGYRVELLSGYVATLLGYPVEECLSREVNWLTYMHPDDRDHAVACAQAIFAAAGTPGSYRCRWIARDGRVLWTEARAVAVCDDAGTPTGLRGVTFDITAQVEAEDRAAGALVQREQASDATARGLRESESRYRQLVHAAPDAMVVTDHLGQINVVNAHAEQLFGYPAAELVGKPIEVLFPSGARISRTEVERSVVLDPLSTTLTRELIGRRRDGTMFPVELRLSPLRTVNELLVSATIRDLTARLQAQEQHERLIREQAARTEAEAASRRFAFLAQAGAALNASLDYRTTLGSVARLLVPMLADLCVVHLLQRDGSLVAVESASVQPHPLRAPPGPYPPVPLPQAASEGPWAVLRSGRSELHVEVSDAALAGQAPDASALERWRSAGINSAIVVPLPAHGVPLGTLTLLACAAGRRLTEQDLALAEEVGRLCGVAVEHSRLYEEAQRELAERRVAEERLRAQSRQQAVVTELGHLAFADGDIQWLLAATARAVETSLGLDVVLIGEVLPEERGWVLRAEVGDARPMPKGGDTIPGPGTLAAHTLATRETVLVDDFAADDRFPVSAQRLHGRYAAAVCAPIVGGAGRVNGLLFGLSRATRRFGVDDRNFLEAVANVVAGAWARARAAAALEAEKERLAVTLRSIGDGVIATDTDARVVLLNTVAETMTGWAQTDAIGRPVEEVFRLVDARTHGVLPNPVTRALAAQAAVGPTSQGRLLARDGTERVVDEGAAPIRDADGRLHGVVLVFRDETDKERIAAELQRAGTLDSLGLFAGGIAHDFNNILTGILANLSLARAQSAVTDRSHLRLVEAERAALRARELTQQLLTFAKGGIPIRKPASIEEIVRESASFMLRGSAVRPHFDVEPRLWGVEVDPGQISQVVQNLVLNAQQAMPLGGRVDVRLRNVRLSDQAVPVPPGPYVRVDVVDTGEGISAEHLPQVFHPFFTTKRRGSGLGLATAYSILKKHDGHITVESTVGRGTRFSVYLPASGAAPDRAPEGTPRTVIAGTGRVLVMDDEEVVRSTLMTLLGALGYRATETEDGEQAVDAWRRAMAAGDPYDCVIMDLTVPGGMGGLPAIRGILAIDPPARGIVSSGYSDDPVMSDFATYGFSDVLTKPYTLAELGEVLRRVVVPAP